MYHKYKRCIEANLGIGVIVGGTLLSLIPAFIFNPLTEKKVKNHKFL